MNFLKHRKLVSCEISPNYTLADLPAILSSLFLPFGFSKAENYCRRWFINYLQLNSSVSKSKLGKQQKLVLTKNPNQPEATDFSKAYNLEQEDQEFLYFTDNGRTGMHLLLKSLNLDSDSQVLIQAFSCVVLPNAVLQAGLIPVILDANTQDYNFSLSDARQKLTGNTKVLVVQYTFGMVPNMEEVIRFCEENNLVLIEDCAHALGATAKIYDEEVPVGTIGHGSFFSFGRDKIVSTTTGGLAFVNPNPKVQLMQQPNPIELTNRLQEFYVDLPKMSAARIFQNLYYALVGMLLIRPLYHFQLGKIILVISRKLRLIGEIYTKNETQGTNKIETNSRYANRLFKLLQSQLQQIDKFNLHRKNLARIYSDNLNLPFQPNNAYLRFPINCQELAPNLSAQKSKELYQKIKKQLRLNGIIVGQWYTSLYMQPKLNLSAFQISIDNLPVANQLSNETVLNLPTNIHTSQADAEKICQIIKKLLN